MNDARLTDEGPNPFGDVALRAYAIYGPPEHPHGTVHATKADADADEHDH